jgi:succinate-semialdehyde dehydrogenase/glutarate-semialdehyde dehydrogenase
MFLAKHIDDAIRVANDSRFALGASARSNDGAEQEKLVNKLEAGMVFINRMVASYPRVPFGGVNWSGHGTELGAIGIREFTDVKTMWMEAGQ